MVASFKPKDSFRNPASLLEVYESLSLSLTSSAAGVGGNLFNNISPLSSIGTKSSMETW
jgi:hypothetical protein